MNSQGRNIQGTPRPRPATQKSVQRPVTDIAKYSNSLTNKPLATHLTVASNNLKIVAIPPERRNTDPLRDLGNTTQMSIGYGASTPAKITLQSPREHVPERPDEGYEPKPKKHTGGSKKVELSSTRPRISPVTTASLPKAVVASLPKAVARSSLSNTQLRLNEDREREYRERDLRDLEYEARRDARQQSGKYEYRSNSHAPSPYARNSYATGGQAMGEIQSVRFPDSVVEMTTAYGTFRIKDYRLVSKQERDIALQSYFRKFEQLQRDWSHVADVQITAPHDGEDVTTVALRYAETEKSLLSRTGSDFWFLCLCGLWGMIQYFFTKMGFKLDGYIQNQIRTSSMYRSLLNKAGGEVTSFGEDWSPWTSVLVTSLVSGAVIVVLNKLDLGVDAAMVTKEIATAICGNSSPVEMSAEGTPMPQQGGLAATVTNAMETMTGGGEGVMGGMMTGMMGMLGGMFGGGGGKSDKKRSSKKKKAAKEKRRAPIEANFD